MQGILQDVYLEMVNEALKKGKDKLPENIIRCCECGRSDKTLRKLHSKVYACTDCINKRAVKKVVDKKEK
jgi:hypothetical protein